MNLTAQAGAVVQGAREDPGGFVPFSGGTEGDAQVALFVGIDDEVTGRDVGEGQHPAVAAFVAFTGGLQRRNDAVIHEKLDLALGDFSQTGVGAEGAVRTTAAGPLGDGAVRNLTGKGEGAGDGAGQA